MNNFQHKLLPCPLTRNRTSRITRGSIDRDPRELLIIRIPSFIYKFRTSDYLSNQTKFTNQHYTEWMENKSQAEPKCKDIAFISIHLITYK